MEPGTPPSAKLFETVAKFAKRRVICGVNIDPIIPLVTDSVEELRAVVLSCKAAGASNVFGSVLRIRSDIWTRVSAALELLGIQDWYERYSEIYDLALRYGYANASEKYSGEIEKRLSSEIRALGLGTSFPKHLGTRKILRARLGQRMLQDFQSDPKLPPAFGSHGKGMLEEKIQVNHGTQEPVPHC